MLPMGTRIKLGSDGSLRLPGDLLDRLGWKSGSFIEASEDGGAVRLERVEVDPFAEAMKPPDPDALEKALEAEKRSRAAALASFEEKLRSGKVPEARPEDRPDFWR
jgi:hypothetical protein